MEQKDIKLLFDAGAIKEVFITRTPLGNGGWSLYVILKTGAISSLNARDNQPREYATVDTVYNVARKIGFRRVSIVETLNDGEVVNTVNAQHLSR